MTDPGFLTVAGAEKRFGASVVLGGVDLAVARGEFVSLLGPSGCGKSTLLYMIAGLEEVTGGEILADGDPVTGPSAERGLIFQDASLFPWLTIADNVAFGLAVQHVPPVKRRELAVEMLRRVGLGDMLDKKPDELSGGMRQRAACARALAMRPKVLMMDEPFAALDALTRRTCQDELLQLWEETKFTVLFVTHSIAEAIKSGNRILLLSPHPGRVKAEVRDVDKVFAQDGSAGQLEQQIHDLLFAGEPGHH